MIQHVTHTITPSQLEECVAFYGLLGFRQVPVPEGIAGRAIWLEHERDGSAAQIHLMPRAEASPEDGHFALVLGDYEQVVEGLRAAGHEVDDAPAPLGIAAQLCARSGRPPDRADAVATGRGTGLKARIGAVDLGRIGWLVTVGVCAVAILVLAVQGYYGYAGVTLAVAISAAINLR